MVNVSAEAPAPISQAGIGRRQVVGWCGLFYRYFCDNDLHYLGVAPSLWMISGMTWEDGGGGGGGDYRVGLGWGVVLEMFAVSSRPLTPDMRGCITL